VSIGSLEGQGRARVGTARAEKLRGKTPRPQLVVAEVSACGTLLTAFAESGADLNVDRREADGLVVTLQSEGDAVHIGAPEDVLDREAPLISDLPASYGGQSVEFSDSVPSPQAQTTVGQ